MTFQEVPRLRVDCGRPRMSQAINDNQVRCMSRRPIFVDIGLNRTSVEVIAAHDHEHGEPWALRIFDFTFSLHGPVNAIR